MTDIEAKALALVNEVQADWNYLLGSLAFKRDRDVFSEALCRAIEQHEAYKQEVSDVVESITSTTVDDGVWRGWASDRLSKFIIPKPKPDPLVEAIEKCAAQMHLTSEDAANALRAALEARGLEIREKDKCQ